MSVELIIKGAVVVQKTIPGIKDAFDNAPESLNSLPCFVTYPDSFTVDRTGPNLKTFTYQLRMMLLVSRAGDISGADAILKPYIQQVVDTFDQNITLGGTAWDSGINAGKYGHIEYGGVTYLGIDFTLQAQERYSVVYKG